MTSLYWIAVGKISDMAKAAIKEVGGKIVRMHSSGDIPVIFLIGIPCLNLTEDITEVKIQGWEQVLIHIPSSGLSLKWSSRMGKQRSHIRHVTLEETELSLATEPESRVKRTSKSTWAAQRHPWLSVESVMSSLHWIVAGKISDMAKTAIKEVGGKIIRMHPSGDIPSLLLIGIPCLNLTEDITEVELAGWEELFIYVPSSGLYLQWSSQLGRRHHVRQVSLEETELLLATEPESNIKQNVKGARSAQHDPWSASR